MFLKIRNKEMYFLRLDNCPNNHHIFFNGDCQPQKSIVYSAAATWNNSREETFAKHYSALSDFKHWLPNSSEYSIDCKSAEKKLELKKCSGGCLRKSLRAAYRWTGSWPWNISPPGVTVSSSRQSADSRVVRSSCCSRTSAYYLN